MKIGLYIISALLFVIATAVAVYMINPGTYSFDAFGIHLPNLPLSIWIAIPVALLAIFSILHMIVYGTKAYLNNKKWKNDAKRVEDTVYWSLIKEPTVVDFAHDDLKKSIALLFNSTLQLKDYDTSELTPKIKDTLKVVRDIENGKFIDLSRVKFAKHLSEDNELVILNHKNHLNEEANFALKVLDFKDKYPKEVYDLALDKAVETQDFYTLKKYAKELGKERFFKLLNRIDKKNDLGFNQEILLDFLKNYDFDCKDYLRLVEKLLEQFNPDENLKIFKEFVSKDEDATSAYLYLLFRYELLDKVEDILDEHDKDEYKAFRALLILKRNKHNFKVFDFINEENACK